MRKHFFNTWLKSNLSYALGLTYSNLEQEAESQEYGACRFDLGQKHIKFRVAKITPTKIGQFVTIWKRPDAKGPIFPCDIQDLFDFLMVHVDRENHSGCFIFPKQILLEKGLLSKDGLGGKRAMQVYPVWDVIHSVQAKKNSNLATYLFCRDSTFR